MSQITANRFEFSSIHMDVSTSIIRDALAPYELKNLASKIVALAVFPFLMIAAFEAILINGTKILFNTVILLLNAAHGCFFPNERVTIAFCSDQPEPSGPAERVDLSIHAVPASITMPPINTDFRRKIAHLVKCLEVDSPIELGIKSSSLNQLKVDLADVHPFQFLEAIFGDFSSVKDCMPGVMSRSWGIPSSFLGGFISSMKEHPTHRSMVGPYLHSFAKKMKTSSEKIKSYMIPTQDWDGLVKHLISIHSKVRR